VFGVPNLPDLDAAAIDSAISRNEVEDFDLDWKESHYPQNKNFELAKDVAALANTAGGIIVLGVKETDGRAVKSVPVTFAGSAERIVNVLARKIQPFLAGVDCRQIPTAAGEGYEAVVNGQVTHSGDPRLARHVSNAVLKEDARGTRLAKVHKHKHTARRIDLAVAAVMAHAQGGCEGAYRQHDR
jgi:hypothetical protein